MGVSTALAVLAGARRDLLKKAPGDLPKHAAMGGVLLTTAAVAGVSAFFALYSMLKLPWQMCVLTGIGWAVVVLNLDRMLVMTMSRQSSLLLRIATAIPRVLLAIVIGSVISVPLVLRIFQPEIDNELYKGHSEHLIADQRKLDKQFADIGATQTEVDRLQAVASGTSQPSVSSDPDVVAAQKQVDDAQTAYNTAAAAAQCELDGSCGTHNQGVGEAYRQAKAKADQANATLDQAKAKLSAVTAAAQARIAGSTTSNREAAQQRLDTLEPRLEQRKKDRVAAQARLDSGELNDEGLLARVVALEKITTGNPAAMSARRMLFLLFLCIEVLPVTAKLLSTLGPPSLYDRLAGQEDAHAGIRMTCEREVAEIEANTRLVVARQQADAKIEAGKVANQALGDKQKAIALKAVNAWGQVATQRTDEELDRWHHDLDFRGFR